MKRAEMLLFLLFLFVIPYVSAQDSYCQYGFTESYSENEMVLTYEDSNVISGKVPVFSDFAKRNKSSSFMVFNPNDYDILIVFNYTVEGHGGANRNYGLKVSPYNYSPVRETCYADNTFGECSINQSTLTYFISKPRIMYPKRLNVNKTREICCPDGQMNCGSFCRTPSIKMVGEEYLCNWECQSGVGNGVICKWNDGHICKQPTDCLSSECNFAGFCGPYVNGQCPNGTQNCNNTTCKKPSNKTEGEAYSCVWECQPWLDAKDWICQKSMKVIVQDLLRFVAIIGLILALARYLHWKGSNAEEKYKEQIAEAQQKLAEIERKIEIERKRWADELDKLKRDKDKITEDLKNVRTRLETETKSFDLKIKELKEEYKNADQKAKEAVRIKMENLEARNKARRAQLDKEEKEIQEKEKRNKAESERIKSQLEQENAEIEEKTKKFEDSVLENNAKLLGLKKEDLEFNDARYIKFIRYPDGNPSTKLLHVWVAENQIYSAHKEFFSNEYPNRYLGNGGLEVHHIDYNKYNNVKENLAIISKEEHARITHKDIPKKDRGKGIQILKERGIKQPHIPQLRTQP